MFRKTFSILMIALLFLSMIMLASNVHLAGADAQTVYINTDGSITPSSAPIVTSDNVTYTFVGDISNPTYYEIVVQRSNIIIDGDKHTLQGSGIGFNLTNVSNVTVRNTDIEDCYYSIYLNDTYNVIVSGNDIAASIFQPLRYSNQFDISTQIWVSSSSNIEISRNSVMNGILWIQDCSNMNISDNDFSATEGIAIWNSSNNTLSGNNMSLLGHGSDGIEMNECWNNTLCDNIVVGGNNGIELWASTEWFTEDTIIRNEVLENYYGMSITNCEDNLFENNNFVNNTHSITADYGGRSGVNSWKENYWSDYNGFDTDGDGIGESWYHNSTSDDCDLSPLIHPYGSIRNLNTNLVYYTIQSALNASETLDYHTISADEGVYHEHLIINKPVFLQGNNRNTTVISGNNTGTVVEIEASGVSINGFTIEESGINFSDSGIYLAEGSYGNNISDNIISDNNLGIRVKNSINNTISRNKLTYNDFLGVGLVNSSGNCITENEVYSGESGIYLYGSGRNIIVENNLHTLGPQGDIWLIDSSNNLIYLNNFRREVHPVQTKNSINTWDNGYPSGGNYWSDYNSTDLYSGPNQNETGSDGIGDSSYIIDANNTDSYPLTGIFSDFNATSGQNVQTISNSTISDFQYSARYVAVIRFKVTGENGTTGFCRICIPTALMDGTYKIYVNDTEVPYTLLLFSNSTCNYLYLNYAHSTEEVIITPEYPSILILTMVIMIILLAVTIYRREHGV
jgi:parallel beta-helix repeat protein